MIEIFLSHPIVLRFLANVDLAEQEDKHRTFTWTLTLEETLKDFSMNDVHEIMNEGKNFHTPPLTLNELSYKLKLRKPRVEHHYIAYGLLFVFGVILIIIGICLFKHRSRFQLLSQMDPELTLHQNW